MLRLGAPFPQTREMDLDDIYLARVRLLVIMAKAYLNGYQMGDYRSQAILENARHVESESIDIGGMSSESTNNKALELSTFDHVFYQRVKLLAVMMKAVAKGFPMGDHRKTAMEENIDMICQPLAFNGQREDISFLKVA
jgi:hypothetical protein